MRIWHASDKENMRDLKDVGSTQVVERELCTRDAEGAAASYACMPVHE